MIYYNAIIDFLGVLILIFGFAIIAENFIRTLIRHLQWQSSLLALLILAVGIYKGVYELVILSVLTVLFRGWLIPEILLKDVKKEGIWEHREISTSARHSLVIGIIVVISGFILYAGLYPLLHTWKAAIPFVLILLGLTIIILRKNAIAQISGYIVEENALLYIGVVLAPMGFLLEVGILLDIIGAVLLAVILGSEKEYGPLELEELSG